jgi:hypothetical protein
MNRNDALDKLDKLQKGNLTDRDLAEVLSYMLALIVEVEERAILL